MSLDWLDNARMCWQLTWANHSVRRPLIAPLTGSTAAVMKAVEKQPHASAENR